MFYIYRVYEKLLKVIVGVHSLMTFIDVEKVKILEMRLQSGMLFGVTMLLAVSSQKGLL